MLTLQNSLCVQSAISITLVLVVCLLMGIPYKDILVIILLSSITVFIIRIGNLYLQNPTPNNKPLPKELLKINKKVNNENNNDNNNKNNELTKNNNLKINKIIDETNNNVRLNQNGEGVENNKNNTQLPYHLHNSSDNIISADKYNLEDCTTDSSCLQKPDETNLFPGFDKEEKLTNRKFETNQIIGNIPNLPTISNPSLKKDNIVVEKFEASESPAELNDIVTPFNNTIINPYQHHDISNETLKEDKYTSDINNDPALCFNCKVGHCEGGVCRDENEINRESIKNAVKDINKLTKLTKHHPFSRNFPTVRISNPDGSY